MFLRILFSFLTMQSIAFSNWDSKKIDPSQKELDAASKVAILREIDSVDTKKCHRIGDLKLTSFSKGQPENVVAIRKYPNASVIKHTASRMHGGFFGEAPTDFFDVYQCEK